MKNYLFSLFLISGICISAQVGINTQSPDPSAALDVKSNNKGITFPQSALQSNTDAITIPTRTESLLIYNTNNLLLGKKGYYFWNGSKWDYFFSDLNQTSLQNQVKYYSANSATPYTFTRNPTNQFYGYSAHAAGEVLNIAQWTVITPLTKTISIDRGMNAVLFNINGMYQANNASSTSGIMSTIGFFVDDLLVDVKPMYLDFSSSCNYRQFMIYGTAQNLTIGSHTVKFAVRNISAPNISGLTVTYGGPNSGCSSLNSFESAISSTIYINQPYEF